MAEPYLSVKHLVVSLMSLRDSLPLNNYKLKELGRGVGGRRQKDHSDILVAYGGSSKL